MSTQKSDPVIPPSAQIVLDFFDNELAEVKFPDIDQEVLQQAAERVLALAEDQAKAEAALQVTREALQEGQDQLLSRCQRALSYAKVYAEEDPDLSRRLDAVNLQRPGRGKTQPAPIDGADAKVPGKRGRRATASGGALFSEVQQGVFSGEHHGANGVAG